MSDLSWRKRTLTALVGFTMIDPDDVVAALLAALVAVFVLWLLRR